MKECKQLELLSAAGKPQRYPDVPGYANGSDTSMAAAKSVEPVASKIRALVRDRIRCGGGLTCEEVELATNLSHQTVSARIRELVLGGMVYDSGLRRLNKSGRKAAVWVV